jgi:hypothetical protein
MRLTNGEGRQTHTFISCMARSLAAGVYSFRYTLSSFIPRGLLQQNQESHVSGVSVSEYELRSQRDESGV